MNNLYKKFVNGKLKIFLLNTFINKTTLYSLESEEEIHRRVRDRNEGHTFEG